jgi:hypothetical protein
MISRRTKAAGALALLALAGLASPTLGQIPQPVPRPIPKPRPKTVPAPVPKPQSRPSPRTRSRPKARPAAPGRPGLPQAVQNYLQSICARAGGRLGNAAESVVFADFTGDGARDYFIDQRNVRCTGATRPQRSGAQFEASLFVTVGTGAQQAALVNVANASVDRSGAVATLWLEGVGEACGIVPAEQRCRNRLAWNPAEARMAYTERQYLDAAGRIVPGPLWPAIAADIPPAFVQGSLKLKKKGGCTQFYRQGGNARIADAINSRDWNGSVRSVVDLGCSTDIAWFVLGYAAEKLGKFEAARRYYVEAGTLTRKPSLSNIYRICARVDVPNPCLGIHVANTTAEALGRLRTAP